jgi:hypothetical protein
MRRSRARVCRAAKPRQPPAIRRALDRRRPTGDAALAEDARRAG